MLELTLFFDLRAIKGARIVLFVAATGSYKPGREEHAPVAQRIERLTTDQKVGGSSPFGRASSSLPLFKLWLRAVFNFRVNSPLLCRSPTFCRDHEKNIGYQQVRKFF